MLIGSGDGFACRSRYSSSAATRAALTLTGSDEEGYAVAEHVEGERTVYCRRESERIENETMKAAAEWQRSLAEAVGPYAIANQGF